MRMSSTLTSMSSTLTSNSYHLKYVWLICLLIQIHKFIKIFIFINDSSDSNHSSNYTAFVVVAFRKNEERKRRKQQAIQTSSEYCIVSMLIILLFLILVKVAQWEVEINNIMRSVKGQTLNVSSVSIILK